jgi:hypothetical protein
VGPSQRLGGTLADPLGTADDPSVCLALVLSAIHAFIIPGADSVWRTVCAPQEHPKPRKTRAIRDFWSETLGVFGVITRLHQAAGHSDIRESQGCLHVPPAREAEDAPRLDAYLTQEGSH